jgi:FkbM family methyltransferase
LRGVSASKDTEATARALVRGLRKEFANWYILGPLSWIVLPSRLPPRGGIAHLAGRRVTVKIRGGYKAQCRLDEFFPFVEVFALRAYDVANVCWTHLRTIVDVGANVGAATLWFARQSPHATIIAVEPASSVRSVLVKNIRANHLEGRTEVVAAALADHSGSVALDQSAPSVSRKSQKAGSGVAERVPALSLNELLDGFGLGEVDLLKLDCEGAEFDVLLSSDDRVLRRNRVIVGEYHSANPGEQERLIARLKAAGFHASSSGDASLGLFEAVRAS